MYNNKEKSLKCIENKRGKTNFPLDSNILGSREFRRTKMDENEVVPETREKRGRDVRTAI